MEDFRDRNFSLEDGVTKRQAEKKLKSNLNHVEVVKNRIKVLTSQANYNRFRQQYQTNKIERHYQLHAEIVKERQEVDHICKSRDHSQKKKEINERMNQEMKERIGEAVEKVRQEKNQQSQQLRLRSHRNVQFLAKRKMKRLEQNRFMRENVKKVEDQIRQSVARYNSEKKEQLRMLKQLQKRSMFEMADQLNRQIKQLSSKQQQLVNISSESFMASRIKDQQYKNLYGNKNFGKSVHFPGIKKMMDEIDTQYTR